MSRRARARKSFDALCSDPPYSARFGARFHPRRILKFGRKARRRASGNIDHMAVKTSERGRRSRSLPLIEGEIPTERNPEAARVNW